MVGCIPEVLTLLLTPILTLLHMVYVRAPCMSYMTYITSDNCKSYHFIQQKLHPSTKCTSDIVIQLSQCGKCISDAAKVEGFLSEHAPCYQNRTCRVAIRTCQVPMRRCMVTITHARFLLKHEKCFIESRDVNVNILFELRCAILFYYRNLIWSFIMKLVLPGNSDNMICNTQVH